MASSFKEVCRFAVHTKTRGLRFRIFPPEPRFQKSAFSGTQFTGSMWMIGQNDAKNVVTQKSISMGTGSQFMGGLIFF